MKFLKILCFCSIAAVLLFSCGKDGDNDPQASEGTRSLIALDSVAPGQICANGGVNIKTGIDKNKNNKLDENEVGAQQVICNGTNGNQDKQITLNFAGGGGDAEVATMRIYPNFNINNYPGIDSVIIVSAPYTYFIGAYPEMPAPAVPPVTKLELFNLTDNTPIEGSSIVTTQTLPNQLIFSSNARAGFPNKTFDLGLTITREANPSTGGRYVGTYTGGFIFMYRK